jgi:hypothetical protein
LVWFYLTFGAATSPKHYWHVLFLSIKQGKKIRVPMEGQRREKKDGPTPCFPTLFFSSLTVQRKEPQNINILGLYLEQYTNNLKKTTGANRLTQV